MRKWTLVIIAMMSAAVLISYISVVKLRKDVKRQGAVHPSEEMWRNMNLKKSVE